MALIDELKDRHERQTKTLAEVFEAIKEREDYRLVVEAELDDLERCIAALEPLLEPYPDIQFEDEKAIALTPAPAPAQADPPSAELRSVTPATEEASGDQFWEDASEFAEPVPDPEFFVLDEQTCKPLDADLAQVLHDNMDQLLITDEAPALNEAMQDEREEGYAPVTNPEAHIQAVEAERFAQPTNPDADAIARAHDWYDPKAVAERNKFNPFSLFRAKEDA